MRLENRYVELRTMNTFPMKTAPFALVLFCLLILGAGPAAGQVVSPVESVFPDAGTAPTRPADLAESPPPPVPVVTEAEWKALLQRLDALEARLGPGSRPPSIAYNIERRIAELERRVQQMEQTVTRLQSLDSRVRKLEMK